MKREYGDYIQDILNSVDAIEEFVKDTNFETFENAKDSATLSSSSMRNLCVVNNLWQYVWGMQACCRSI